MEIALLALPISRDKIKGENHGKIHDVFYYSLTFSERIPSLKPHHTAGSFLRESKEVGSTGTA
jgi:hypothetical protein